MKLHSWQQKDVDSWIAAGGIGLNASETGAGKTIISLGAVKQSGAKVVLIIGPQGTYYSWNDTAERFLGQTVKRIDRTAQGKRNYTSAQIGVEGIYFIGTELFRNREWRASEIDFGIIDEVHKLTTRGTKGLTTLTGFQPRFKLALSATPLRNKLENSWGVIKWLYPNMEYWRPDEDFFRRHPKATPETLTQFITKKHKRKFKLKSGKIVEREVEENIQLQDLNPKYFRQFTELFFKLKRDFFKDGGLVAVGERTPGEVFDLLPSYVRHLKRERCCEAHPEGFADWPEPQDIIIQLPMTAKQKRYYEQVDHEQVAWLEGRPLTVGLPIVERIRKTEACLGEMLLDEEGRTFFPDDAKSNKINWVLDNMKDGVLEDEQFVCFTHSKKFAKVAAKRLGAFEWSGDASDESRDKAREAFVAGELRVIVAVISAVGTGTDFMQKSHIGVWFSKSVDGTDNTQTEGRQDRGGQTKGVLNYILQSEGTEEAGWYSKTMKKVQKLRETLAKKG